jgi:glycosyltransferase involved in cell wall biosynthesis
MKILIVVEKLKIGGGAEKIASILGTYLNRKGYKIYYLTFYDFEPKYYFEGEYYTLNENVNNSLFDKLKKLFVRARKISQFCKKKDIDIVISFMETANFPATLSKIIFNSKLKLIVGIHTNPEIYISKKNNFYTFLIKVLYPFSNLIITVSKEAKNILISKYNFSKINQKIKVLYNGYDISEYIIKSNEPLEEEHKKLFDNNSFIFINVGRLAEPKGQWFLIRCFKKVVEKYPNAKLIILGDGELRKKLQELINKLDLQNNIYLLGRQENPYKFLKNSDCFVLSSLWEGFSNALIEALSLNLPIISTDCKAGPREILCPELNINNKINYPYYGRYGILTKPFPREFIWENLDKKPLLEEEKLLADLMIEMIEDESLRRKYNKSLERAKDFDIEKIIKEWEEIIKSL